MEKLEILFHLPQKWIQFNRHFASVFTTEDTHSTSPLSQMTTTQCCDVIFWVQDVSNIVWYWKNGTLPYTYIHFAGKVFHTFTTRQTKKLFCDIIMVTEHIQLIGMTMSRNISIESKKNHQIPIWRYQIQSCSI